MHTCNGCSSTIGMAKPFFRWNMMEFCSTLCIDYVIKANVGRRCWTCECSISISSLFVHTEYVENELRLFCSSECMTNYLDAVQMCEHCQKVMKPTAEGGENTPIFCSKQCENRLERMFANASDCEEKFCTDCDVLKPVKFNMVYNGKSYPFCSFACFFFVKFSCGIYAGEFLLKYSRNYHLI